VSTSKNQAVIQMKSTGNATAPTKRQEPDKQSAKPDVSDQDYNELLPKLMSYFNNDREELARALGLNRSTVDRWFNGKSRPNNSTVLRMRNLARERLTAT
jgi:transcriptional regulator with XRE-family HTH domain